MAAGGAHRPYGCKQPRSKRGVAAMLSAPRKKARKARPAGPLSPVIRAHAGGKATSSGGIACSLDRNYKRFVMFENRARYLADPEHRGVIRGDLDGDQDTKTSFRRSIDLTRKQARQCAITGTSSGYQERDEERGVCFGQ
jgi:hypothetical protein